MNDLVLFLIYWLVITVVFAALVGHVAVKGKREFEELDAAAKELKDVLKAEALATWNRMKRAVRG